MTLDLRKCFFLFTSKTKLAASIIAEIVKDDDIIVLIKLLSTLQMILSIIGIH